MKKKKKRSVTLIEIMIVILLIGLIGGALAVNMRGSVDKGKIFKSEQNASRVYDILMLEYAKGDLELDAIVEQKAEIVKRSPLTREGSKILTDAWGKDLKIDIIDDGNDLFVYSEKVMSLTNANPTS